MVLRRGFKTQSENMAQQLRNELDLAPVAPLAPTSLAKHLEVRVVDPKDIPDLSDSVLTVLGGDGRKEWSAVTLSGGRHDLVIVNPWNSEARQSSDLMHELAHLVLRHEPSVMMFAPDGAWALRSYDEEKEEEANWLSGSLLLPRPALLQFARSGKSDDSVKREFRVSQALLTYRRNVTGVNRQNASARRNRSS